MSVAVTRDDELFLPQPVNISKARRQHMGDTSHNDEDDVTAKEDRMEAAITAMAQAVTTQALKNGNGVKETMGDRVHKFAPTVLMIGALLITTSRGMGASDVTQAKAVEHAEERAAAAEVIAKRAQLNVQMLDTYNRELERAIIASRANIKLPSYPVLDK